MLWEFLDNLLGHDAIINLQYYYDRDMASKTSPQDTDEQIASVHRAIECMYMDATHQRNIGAHYDADYMCEKLCAIADIMSSGAGDYDYSALMDYGFKF